MILDLVKRETTILLTILMYLSYHLNATICTFDIKTCAQEEQYLANTHTNHLSSRSFVYIEYYKLFSS